MSKGSKRRPGNSQVYVENWERIFGDAATKDVVECPDCGEIEFRPTGVDNLWECHSCKKVATL